MDKGNAKKGINYTSEPIKLLRVDIECIHCAWRSIERLPFVLDGSDHWLECPECGKSSRFELAIIKYIGESE